MKKPKGVGFNLRIRRKARTEILNIARNVPSGVLHWLRDGTFSVHSNSNNERKIMMNILSIPFVERRMASWH
jgi:hypothetical protein